MAGREYHQGREIRPDADDLGSGALAPITSIDPGCADKLAADAERAAPCSRAAEALPSTMRTPAASDNEAAEADMVRRLEGTARFRVLRAIPDYPSIGDGAVVPRGVGTGIIVDVETTGLDVLRAEILELGMVRFAYDKSTGGILGICDRFSGLRQPWSPIPPEVTRLTGIDDAMVAGHDIDRDEVAAFVRDADLVIAHNARFDRGFVEGRWPFFAQLPWACSCADIDWRLEGYEGTKLGHLLMQAGYFFAGHRAIDDAMATLCLLALPLPKSGRPGLAALLDQARAPTWRVWAERAPFELKDVLKARGYRWSPGLRGLPRSWYRDLDEEAVDAEVEFLVKAVFRPGAKPRVVPVTAHDRFTDRAGVGPGDAS